MGQTHDDSRSPERGRSEPGPTTPPDRFARLFADLQTQAEAYAALDDLAEADALAIAEIARISWADRLRAVGSVEIALPDGRLVAGEVAAVVTDGVHLCGAREEWIVRADAVQSLRGLGPRMAPASRVDQRLTVASILRRWVEEGAEVQCLSVRGRRDGTVVRVGADHLDLVEQHHNGDQQAVSTIPLAALWAIRRG